MEYKVIADTLASLASFVAIVSVMIGWYCSARKPLRIKRVVVHKKGDETSFILEVKNVKPFPVTIINLECYRTKKYEIQKKLGGKPEYYESFPLNERLSYSNQLFEIGSNGHTNIKITSNAKLDIPEKLLFLFKTSHGFHELWCKNISIVDIGKVDVYGVEYKHDYDSKFKAKLLYYWKLIKELTHPLTKTGR